MESREEINQLIKKHLEIPFHPSFLASASVKNFAETGKISGTFCMAIKELLKEYSDQQNKALLEEIERFKFELDNIKIESSHEISDLVKTQQETQKQLDDTFHQLEGSIKHVEQLQSDLKAADSVNEGLSKENKTAIELIKKLDNWSYDCRKSTYPKLEVELIINQK